MKMENYFLPHMGHVAVFPTPLPLPTTVVSNYISPLSVHVEEYLIQHYLFKDFGCCASVLTGPLPWLAIEAAITPFPLSLSVEFHTIFQPFWKC